MGSDEEGERRRRETGDDEWASGVVSLLLQAALIYMGSSGSAYITIYTYTHIIVLEL